MGVWSKLVLASFVALPAFAQTDTFKCLHDPQDPPKRYVQQTRELSCGVASDINGAIDARWAPESPTDPRSPQEMATIVTSCLEAEGLYRRDTDGRGGIVLGAKSDAEIAAAYCRCNELITSEDLWCQATLGKRDGNTSTREALDLSATDAFILAHALPARCVAMVMLYSGEEGHVLEVTGGTLDDDGSFSLETREPNRPNSKDQPKLQGHAGEASLTYSQDSLYWGNDENGSPRLYPPGSTIPPLKTMVIGYILKCPVPRSIALAID